MSSGWVSDSVCQAPLPLAWYLWRRSAPKAICRTNRVWWLDCGCALAGSASAVVVISAPADTTATAASLAVRLLLGILTP